MPRDFPRTLRVGEQIHRELALLLRDHVKDPRVGPVTIVDVEVSRDLAHARVYFTLLGDAEQMRLSEAGLRSAAGFLRAELHRRLKIRTVPQLRFIHDRTEERANRIEALIDTELSSGEDRE
jgi:ribosome-binding factor A